MNTYLVTAVIQTMDSLGRLTTAEYVVMAESHEEAQARVNRYPLALASGSMQLSPGVPVLVSIQK
jgi:hypothetical protein